MLKKICKVILIITVILNLYGNSSQVWAINNYEENPSKDAELIQKFFNVIFSLGGGLPAGGGGSSSSSSSSSGSSSAPPIAQPVRSLRELFQEVEKRVGVPTRILEAVMIAESPGLIQGGGLTADQIDLYSKPGETIPDCKPNVCSAAGPMQMTMGIDNKGSSACGDCGLNKCPNAWASYSDSVNVNGGYSHQSHYCNLRDNVYAAAAKLKKDSLNNGGDWTKVQVYFAAERYHGSCSDKYRYERLNGGKKPGKTYCEFLWSYYSLGK